MNVFDILMAPIRAPFYVKGYLTCRWFHVRKVQFYYYKINRGDGILYAQCNKCGWEYTGNDIFKVLGKEYFI